MMAFPKLLRFAAATFAFSLCACGTTRPSPTTSDPAITSENASIRSDTRQFVVHSKIVGRDFVVVVSAPPADAFGAGGERPAGEKLPAIYALDGGYAIAGPIAQMMQSVAAMPPVYVVSVGYPKGVDQRNTDLLFSPITENGEMFGGGGAQFEAFLTDELRPLLEARYPLDENRAILFGHSFGGLFAANVLASTPDAFAGYVIASPSVTRDASVVARISSITPKGAGHRVFVAAGEKEAQETVVGARQIAVALSAHGSAFKTETSIFPGEGHISYYPLLLPAAFRWMLQADDAGAKPKEVVLSTEALDRLTGEYSLPDGRVTTIIRQDAKLFAQMTGMPGRSELSPTSPTRFIIEGFNVVMTFEGPADGQPTELVSVFNGAETRAKRKGQ